MFNSRENFLNPNFSGWYRDLIQSSALRIYIYSSMTREIKNVFVIFFVINKNFFSTKLKLLLFICKILFFKIGKNTNKLQILV